MTEKRAKANGTPRTLSGSEQEKFQKLKSGLLGFLVPTLVSAAEWQDFMEQEVDSFTVVGLLKGTAPEDKPRYLIVENVKHLVSSERGTAFTTVLFELWEAGYDCEWCVVNAQDFGVPQHRERVYLVGHLRDGCAGKVFPFCGTNPAPVKRLVDGKQGKRIYDPSGTSITLTASGGGFAGRTGLYAVSVNRNEGITGELEQAHTLTASDGRGLNRNQEQNAVLSQIPPCAAFIDLSKEPKFTDKARCLRARQYSGIGNYKGETSGIFLCQGHPDCVRAVITPDRLNKRQNGRRFKEPGEPSFTLTYQDHLSGHPDKWSNPED